MVDVVATDEFDDWYQGLNDDVAEDVTVAVDLLEALGVSLGFPQSSEIKGTQHPLRELRIQSQGRPVRVFYAFDPDRQAVLLIGGVKSDDKRFFREFIPRAERLWLEYLQERE